MSKLLAVILVCFVYLVGGCSPDKSSTDKSAQPPTKKNDMALQALEAVLYFADDQAVFLVPEKRLVKYASNLPLTLVEELVKGPKTGGLNPTLPKSTCILGVEIYQGTAFVDLSSDFERDYPGGTTGEGLALGSIIKTLTELEDVYAVQFLIEGKKVEVLAKGHMELTEPLRRNITMGAVDIRREDNKKRQKRVEQGEEQWLLNPLQAAAAEGPLYGLYARGKYELIRKTAQGEYSGMGEAQVKHSYKGENYDIVLVQPEKQGSAGIWVINSIMPLGTQKQALESFLEKRFFRASQGGQVFSVYETLGEEVFDNRKTVFLWVLCQEYTKEGGVLIEKSGVSLPAAITLFSQDENHNGVIDYRIPQDGSNYWPSIERIFPENVQEKIRVRQGNVQDLEQTLRDKAKEYFGLK